MEPLTRIPVSEIEQARERIRGVAVRTPLIPMEIPPTGRRVWLKLENLQPIGSFKLRGATNALASADPSALRGGTYTGSAGNMAQGVAFGARRLGIPCRVVVPDSAPRTKLEAIERLGAEPVAVPYDEWWAVLRDHGHPDESGFFVHPVADPAVIAGNGTIGLEILEDLPEVRTVVVPFGGGGLSCGIASALAERAPDVRVFAAEVESAAPFAASLEAGRPVDVERIPSFVDGIGGNGLLGEMWPLASSLLAGSLVMSLEEVCEAIRLLAGRAHVIAEGAGGCAVAAAATEEAAEGPTVAVVSGGNIDTHLLAAILAGLVP